MSEYLVTVNNLKKYFPVKTGLLKHTTGNVKAVDGISFNIKKGQILGIVGESGCGKSTLGRTILRLLLPTEGEVFYESKSVFHMSKKEMNKMRTKMQIIFQDPYSSLNPKLPVYDIVGEAMLQHKIAKNKKEMKEKVIEIISKCGLYPEQADRYPHQFSGGQRQRICIARALAVNPDFVVCDEAVSALDVSIQSQILNLLKDAQEDFGLTYMFISHDLSVVKFISDEVAVMYLGQIVEKAGKKQIFSKPLHPYTEALLSAAPLFDPSLKRNGKRIILKGDIPSPSAPPKGCRFHTRCPYVKSVCKEEIPVYKEIYTGHFAMCHKVNGVF
ncbi:MAG TPA: peptide ABC transporter substrate-binding protein [Clostridiales bacterium]|jgi:oligopeptide/dipeptide ABC transporter ATP-binding protein|nr:peptide ABC transporter substrate-binding protein [Clostridiales bacterium]HCS09907.1 peptide ABC transporter substrate-binding protein [Clostridiales bacterium]